MIGNFAEKKWQFGYFAGGVEVKKHESSHRICFAPDHVKNSIITLLLPAVFRQFCRFVICKERFFTLYFFYEREDRKKGTDNPAASAKV